jgi:hypothetical protein
MIEERKGYKGGEEEERGERREKERSTIRA